MPYLSMTDAFEENAKRHEANAARHVAEGHPPHYAEGSLRKAAKWRAKKLPEYLKEVTRQAFVPRCFVEIYRFDQVMAALTSRSE